MANLQIINSLLYQKRLTKIDMAKSVGVSPQAIQDMIRNNSTKIETLEKVATFLDVPVSIFFEEKKEKKIDTDKIDRLNNNLEKLINLLNSK